MKDADCTQFLQWALPRLGFRFKGFRKVRRQVCRRIRRRMAALGLPGFDAYRRYLEAHLEEGAVLDGFCRITISRFFRDRGVFEHLGDEVLPRLALGARERGEATVRAWSTGCASGEEPYSLAIVWRLAGASRFPDVELEILATDADERLLDRARRGVYQAGTLRELPADWRRRAFRGEGELYRLRNDFRRGVELRRGDLRTAMPEGPFDLTLCRNLAFTYFDKPLQREVLERLAARLRPGGWLVIGSHESLPGDGDAIFEKARRCFFRRRPETDLARCEFLRSPRIAQSDPGDRAG